MTYRVHLSRAKDYRRPEGTVQVDRATIFGNPWKVGRPGLVMPPPHPDLVKCEWNMRRPLAAQEAVAIYAAWLAGDALPENACTWRETMTLAGMQMVQEAFAARRAQILARLPSLRGHPLGCRCALDQPCHADVLLQLANA